MPKSSGARMKTFSNFAVSFTIISIPVRLSDAVLLRHERGRARGHDAGLAVRRLLRAHGGPGHGGSRLQLPDCGGLYYWAAKIADEAGADGARWSWFVGWFNWSARSR